LEQEYSSNVSHQDGDVPYRLQVTYRDGGPSYYINDYFPHLHYQAAATLADQDYDELINWSNKNYYFREVDISSEPFEKLKREGAVENVNDLI